MRTASKVNNNKCIKIKTFQYLSNQSPRKLVSRSYERNPIRIVIDKIGLDGQYHRQIVNQSQLQETQQIHHQQNISKTLEKNKMRKHQENIHNYYSNNSNKSKNQIIRSQIFNRFHYDNYQKIPTKWNRKSFMASPNKISYHSEKNLQIIFCQSKFPEFVNKTNNKIQEIYKKEQNLLQKENQKFLLSTMYKEQPSKRGKKSTKTTLANCLKQFGTLQKLSNFMESDRNLRQNCLYYGLQKDPSKTLLLDVLTHRFTFMKKISKRLRENIYRFLLGREDINVLTKINVHQYMRFYQMFVGRDSSTVETATFIYLLFFGNNLPTMDLARSVVQQTNGSLHKQRVVLDEIKQILQLNATQIIPILSKNVKLLSNFIDLLVQK